MATQVILDSCCVRSVPLVPPELVPAPAAAACNSWPHDADDARRCARAAQASAQGTPRAFNLAARRGLPQCGGSRQRHRGYRGAAKDGAEHGGRAISAKVTHFPPPWSAEVTPNCFI